MSPPATISRFEPLPRPVPTGRASPIAKRYVTVPGDRSVVQFDADRDRNSPNSPLAKVDQTRQSSLSSVVVDAILIDALPHPDCRATDPVSMSRWIGPDCFGTSSNDLPWLVSPRDPGDQQDRVGG
jgi:hypothetical protein